MTGNEQIILDNNKCFNVISNINATEFDLIYSRQSVDKKDSLSIEFQIERAINDCKCRGTEYIIYFDKGYSAGSTNRPDFQKMLADIKNNAGNKLPKNAKAKNIVIYRYDRINRNVKDFCELIEELSKYKVNVISTSQQIDTSTASGRAMVMQLMVFAQLEREQDSERVTDNIYNRACLGYWIGGPAPFGYISKKAFNESGKKYCSLYENTLNNNDETTDKTNAFVLSEVFNIYNKLQSCQKTAIFLNQHGYRTYRKKYWTSEQVISILRAPVYATNTISLYNYIKENTKINIYNSPDEFDGTKGVFLLRQTDTHKNARPQEEQILFVSKWKGLIDGDYWVQTNKILDSNKSNPAPNFGRSNTNLFSGLLICGSCLQKHNETHYYRIKTQKDKQRKNILYKYYLCNSKNMLGKDYCSNNNLREDILLGIIKKAIKEYANSSKTLEFIYNKQKENTSLSQELENNMKKLQNEISIIDAKIYNILDSFTDIELKNIIEEQIKKMNNQKKDLTTQLKSLEYEKQCMSEGKYSLEYLQHLFNNFDDIFAKSDFEERKLLIRGFIHNVIIYHDHIDVNFYDYTATFKILDELKNTNTKSNFPSLQTGDIFI